MRALLVALLLAAAAAPAAADTLPSGMIGLVGGVRQGIGPVAPQFALGALWGIEAGWQPMVATRTFGWAVRWRTLFSGYWSADAANTATDLRVVEMDVGGALRIAPDRGKGRLVDLGGGISALRTNVPLAPDGHRSYFGPYVMAGLEQFVGSTMSVTFEIRIGEIGGPDTLSALVGIKFGV